MMMKTGGQRSKPVEDEEQREENESGNSIRVDNEDIDTHPSRCG